MTKLNRTTTHVSGSLHNLQRGIAPNQHRSHKAAQAQARWEQRNTDTGRKFGCVVWTREEFEAVSK